MTYFMMGYFALAAILLLNLVVMVKSEPKKSRKQMNVNVKSKAIN